MAQKQIDHEASHSNLINRESPSLDREWRRRAVRTDPTPTEWLHLISSSIFLYTAVLAFEDHRTAMYLGLFSLVLRQAGHYIFEPPAPEKEAVMLGFDTISKVRIVLLYFILPTVFLVQLSNLESVKHFIEDYNVTVADVWIVATLGVVFGRVFVLRHRFSFVVSMHWLVRVSSPASGVED